MHIVPHQSRNIVEPFGAEQAQVDQLLPRYAERGQVRAQAFRFPKIGVKDIVIVDVMYALRQFIVWTNNCARDAVPGKDLPCLWQWYGDNGCEFYPPLQNFQTKCSSGHGPKPCHKQQEGFSSCHLLVQCKPKYSLQIEINRAACL